MQNSTIDTDNRVIRRTAKALEAGIPYILHQGGTSSGKTYGILYALLFFALSKLKAGAIVSIVSLNLPHLKKGAITDFRNILTASGLTGHVQENKSDHVFTLPNKTIFEFYSPDDQEKAKSGKRDLLFINEANGVLYSIANQLMMRTNGPIILDWNPSGKFWLHRMLLPFLKAHEYLFTRSTYKDNKSVSKKIIQELERLKLIDKSMYDIYALGVEGKGTEIIYPVYELVDSFPKTENVGSGLDFGFTNHPSVGIRGAYYDGCLWFEEMFYEKGLSNKQIFELYKTYPFPFGDVIPDSAEPKSIAELKELGLPVRPAVKGPDSIKFGIDKIKEYPIKLVKSSNNLIDEMDAYKWKMVDGRPTNVPAPKQQDHAMDAMRYCIQAILSPTEPVKPQVRKATSMGFTNIGV